MEKIYETNVGGQKRIFFWCPGCQSCHSIETHTHHWDGDVFQPTVRPSLRYKNCHAVIHKGKIYFLKDTTHEMKGLEVELPEFYH